MRAERGAMTAASGIGPAFQPAVLRTLGWCVAVLLIAASLLPLVPRMFAPRMALTLAVSGELGHVAAEDVRLAVAPLLTQDFYELDLAQVRAAVERLPWVARARVERSWPATIGVHVREHRAIARWGDAGLLSDGNVVFVPGALDADALALPRLAGPDGRQAEVRAAHAALIDALRDGPFVPVALELNARGEWSARTAEGVELRLGRGAPIDAVSALNGPVRTALEGRLTEVAYVDLHYINGFAVGWREHVVVDARSPLDGTEERRE